MHLYVFYTIQCQPQNPDFSTYKMKYKILNENLAANSNFRLFPPPDADGGVRKSRSAYPTVRIRPNTSTYRIYSQVLLSLDLIFRYNKKDSTRRFIDNAICAYVCVTSRTVNRQQSYEPDSLSRVSTSTFYTLLLNMLIILKITVLRSLCLQSECRSKVLT